MTNTTTVPLPILVGNWACYECGQKCGEKRSCWKNFRTQHLGIYVHYCTFDNCTSGHSGSKYGNEEQSEVWWHMEQKHGLQSPLDCPKCPKYFASKGSQNAHIIKCGTINKSKFKTYQCPKCNKKYMEANGLEKHMARVHGEGEGAKHEYICFQCGQTFQYVQSLHPPPAKPSIKSFCSMCHHNILYSFQCPPV